MKHSARFTLFVDHRRTGSSVAHLPDGSVARYGRNRQGFTREHVFLNADFAIVETKRRISPDGVLGVVTAEGRDLVTRFDPVGRRDLAYDARDAAKPLRHYRYDQAGRLQEMGFYDAGCLRRQVLFADFMPHETRLLDGHGRIGTLAGRGQVYHFRNAGHDEILWRDAEGFLADRAPELVDGAAQSQIARRTPLPDGERTCHFTATGRFLYALQFGSDAAGTLWCDAWTADPPDAGCGGTHYLFDMTALELVERARQATLPVAGLGPAPRRIFRANAALPCPGKGL